jgi:ATP-dependent RNA helicase SUPV3L1/SUV3
MVAHGSGIIGLPLRLLAREVYQRVAEKVGTANVALVTGEEKIVPEGARYSVCTVEAMPRETDAAFVAIDEVQIADDLERGHIFTDRILHLRGREETLLLGAATMRGILEKLLKGISVVTRPRMSHLAYSGARKITRLPRRSAVVAFSADEVYAIAELIRRQRGGAAVVLGALSPRTRNAQVELYQSGDVDYLVATDAIGMGLNLDVDHVAFAQERKFDGYQYRGLTPAELAQIAGRAGRHMRDGTFGVTGQVNDFGEEIVSKIESHEFQPVRVLQWRTAAFDFSSLEELKRSIETPAPVDGLIKALPGVDAQALAFLARDPQIRDTATSAKNVETLWDACALPDYRRIAPAQHADIISAIYLDLVGNGHVDEDYLARQINLADRTDGDIDTLSHRIAQIRTWTFVSHRPGWLADPTHWQEKTRDIEDRLSDALHERLTKRFVDRRTSVLMKRLREDTMPEAEISTSGEVLVEGHHIGDLHGFRFSADSQAAGEEAKAVRAAAQKALASEFDARAERFAAAPNADLAIGSDGVVRWVGAPLAALSASDDLFKPRAVLLADEQLTGPTRERVQARLDRFVAFQIETLLEPLVNLQKDEQLSGMARGVAFRLCENFGLLDRRDVADEVRALDQDTRRVMRRLGVRFGAYHIFLPALLKPGPAGLLTLLWALANDGRDKPGYGDVVQAMAAGRTSMVVDPAFDPIFYRLAGFRHLGGRAVRVDILERLADLIRPALSWKAGNGPRPDGAYDGRCFIVTPAMMSILGATADNMEQVLKGLGYRFEKKPEKEMAERLGELDAAAARQAAAPTAAETGEEAAAPAASEPASDARNRESGEGGDGDAVAGGEAGTLPVEEADSDKGSTVSAPQEAADGKVEESADPGSEPAPVEGIDTPAAEPASTGAVDVSIVADDLPAERDGAVGEAVSAETQESNSGPSEEAEEKFVLLWRPGIRGGGQHRHRHSRHKEGGGQHDGRGKPHHRKSAKFGRGKDGVDGREGRGPKKGRPMGGKPRGARPEKAPDPDSPFAKLAALKEKLEK